MIAKKKIPGLKINPASVSFSKTLAWNALETGLQEIHSFSNSQLSFEELYRAGYNLVINKHGTWLHSQVENNLRNALMKSLVELLRGENLKEIVKIWKEFNLKLSLIRDILMYLDRSHVQHAKLPCIYDLGQSLFKEIILLDKRVLDFTLSAFLKEIQCERYRGRIDFSLLNQITEMFYSFIDHDSNTYFTILEKGFLDSSRIFYKNEADNLFRESRVSLYLDKINTRREEESQRISLYMKAETLEKVLLVIDEEMLQLQVDSIVNSPSGLELMVKDKSKKDLKLMYNLLSRINNGISEISKAFCNVLMQKVSKINDQVSDQKRNDSFSVWIDGLVEIKKDAECIVTDCFMKDKTITSQSMNTLKMMINQNSKACEFTSLYIDLLLKKGLKGRTEEEVEESLDTIMGVFKFLDEKDVFDRYYKKHLAKRLLGGKSVGEEAETSMISKFKLECGHQFTTKLEGMFNDIRLSAEIGRKFNESCGKENVAPLPTMNISILTSTFWPINSTVTEYKEIIFPEEVRNVLDRFEKFYLSRHSGRKLTWLPHMGNADLKVQFSSCKKEINLSVFSMIILVNCFRKTSSGFLSIQEITALTRIPLSDLIKNLQALSLGKYKILIKSPAGKEISMSDTFTFNTNFQAPLTKLKILGLSGSSGIVEDDAERSKTMEKVDEARKHQIEAAIVRIMKSRQTMDHSNLIAEVISQLSSHFSPSPIMIKKRIEGLIEREYMNRDRDDIRKYVYIA